MSSPIQGWVSPTFYHGKTNNVVICVNSLLFVFVLISCYLCLCWFAVVCLDLLLFGLIFSCLCWFTVIVLICWCWRLFWFAVVCVDLLLFVQNHSSINGDPFVGNYWLQLYLLVFQNVQRGRLVSYLNININLRIPGGFAELDVAQRGFCLTWKCINPIKPHDYSPHVSFVSVSDCMCRGHFRIFSLGSLSTLTMSYGRWGDVKLWLTLSTC